ncbi:MAG: photosynthesis system II assembly factor Ycf48, partial [Pseudanabaenaceae cyanobacterium]
MKVLLKLFLAVLLTFGVGVKAVFAADWYLIQLPTKASLLDITFQDEQLQHGWLVGTDATLFETKDGGLTWEQRNLKLEGLYRFVSVSFQGNEGWIAGKPALLLHTLDGGKSWTRVGLSAKLPGDPQMITALGPNRAEMATDLGAIYQTQDGGRTWKALVKQAVGAVRNLNRSPDGRYIAVSAKGNFYSTWSPGDDAWTQHNRNSSRRVQNMGFGPDQRVWMLNRGGQIQFSKPATLEEWEKPLFPKATEGYGMLDLAYQDEQHIWASGGSSHLLYSEDGGKTWERVENVRHVGANFYS